MERREKLSRSTKKRSLQHHTFIDQSIAALAIYVPSLLVTAFLINLNKRWNYSDRIVLNNEQFNANIVTIIAIGVYSMVLSLFNSHDQDGNSDFLQWQKVLCKVTKGIFLILITILSIVMVNIMMLLCARTQMVYLSVSNDNETHIIQVWLRIVLNYCQIE